MESTYQVQSSCGPTSKENGDNVFSSFPAILESYASSKVMLFSWQLL